jgi:hypothetical protein
MTDLETLAKGLTAAQREAVIGARKSFGEYSLSGSPAALHSLRRKGITEGPFAIRFTDLGLRLRTYLMENPQ